MSYAVRKIPPAAIIDIDDDAELTRWARWLGVCEMEVLTAVATVGPFATAVRDYLTQEE